MAQLSFFDPSLEKYVTIKSTAIEVAAKGTADPPPSQPRLPLRSLSPLRPPSPRRFKRKACSRQISRLVSFTSFASDRRFLVVNGALAVAWSAALMTRLRACGGCLFRSRSNPPRDGTAANFFARWKIPNATRSSSSTGRGVCRIRVSRPMERIPMCANCSRIRARATTPSRPFAQFSTGTMNGNIRRVVCT